MKIIIHWVLSAIAIVVSAYLLSGVHVDGFLTAMIVALVLGAVNGILKPVLVFLTLPITMLTFGLFLVVINTFMIMLSSWIVPGFVVDGFWWALAFGIVLSIVSSVLDSVFKTK